MSSGAELVELALRRRDVLERLRDPAEKRTLVEDLAVSRSTVDRSLRELEVAGLVVRSEAGYRLTPVGRVLATEVASVCETAAGAAAVAEAFVGCPPDAPLEPAALRGASLLEGTTPRESLADLARDAERLELLVPAGGDPAAIDALNEAAWTGVDLTVVLERAVADGLERLAPGAVRVLGAAGTTALAGETPPFWLAVADGRVAAFAPEADAIATADTGAAAEWAEALLAESRAGAEPIDVEPPVGDAAFALEREGFVRLSGSYFADREPDPETCWRVGLGLAEVRAGYAVERRPPDGSSADSFAEHVLGSLREGVPFAVLGTAGSGKSTVCKQVACEWYETGDPVLYREGGAGAAFESPAALRAVATRLEGTPLVVVEDATRPDAVAVFDLLETPGIAVLLDARTDEWEALEDRLVSASAAVARERVETLEVPSVTADTVSRLRETVAETTGRPIELSVESLLSGDSGSGSDSGAGELLSVLHRLAMATDPLAENPPTSLREDVRRAHRRLADAGETALKTAVLASLLNAAGGDVPAAYLHAVDDPGVVADALPALDDVVFFGGEPPHEAWSERFLAELLTVEGAGEAHRLAAETVSSLLALADEPGRRRAIETVCADAAGLERIADDPERWAVATTRRLLAVGEETPALGDLFGPPGREEIAWPAAAPESLPAEYAAARGRMALAGGNYAAAAVAFEAALARLDGESRLRASCLKQLGTVANERGEFETARERYEEAMAAYEALGDDRGVTQCRNNLATLAHLQGDLDAALEGYRACIESYRALGVRDDRADTLTNLGVALKTRGDLLGARDRFDEALELYREVGSDRDVADVLVNISSVELAAGDLPAAARAAREALEAYREIGATGRQAVALTQLATVARHRGRVGTAEEYASAARERYREVDNPHDAPEATVEAGVVARLAGDHERAADRLERARARLEESGDSGVLVDAIREQGRLALERGETGNARERALEALRRGESLGDERRQSAVHRLLAATERADGEPAAARKHAERARSLARSASDRYGEAAALRERAAAAGDGEELREAALLFEECGATADAIETHRAAAGAGVTESADRATELETEADAGEELAAPWVG